MGFIARPQGGQEWTIGRRGRFPKEKERGDRLQPRRKDGLRKEGFPKKGPSSRKERGKDLIGRDRGEDASTCVDTLKMLQGHVKTYSYILQ